MDILGKIDKKVEFNLIIKTKGHWKESLTLEGFKYDFFFYRLFAMKSN